ncbi:MAG: type I methionyl aminopeptidase [Bacteroidaceae bacterium]|nr:type I methionyl aminopeptidase [Bacteroidaceae bacterium]
MGLLKKNPRNWRVKSGVPLTEMDKRILSFQNRGHLVPTRELIKTPEQIEGIRLAGKLNTAVLDHVAAHIKEGMSTLDIDRLVYDFTTQHGGIPAPLNYEGFPKSCCTSINEVVCHGIPDAEEILMEGDIINVDCTTILGGYYADASRMFIIGKTTPEREKLVRVAKECMEIGAEACKPYTFVGDSAAAITKHAHANGFTVVRDLCGHGVGNDFHEEPDMEHWGRRGTGMLLVPGMVFTVEPMINAGGYEVFVDSEDDWTVVTEDYSDSAQWEHTYLLTEDGVETLTY